MYILNITCNKHDVTKACYQDHIESTRYQKKCCMDNLWNENEILCTDFEVIYMIFKNAAS